MRSAIDPGHSPVARKSKGRKGVTLVTQKRGVRWLVRAAGVESSLANTAWATTTRHERTTMHVTRRPTVAAKPGIGSSKSETQLALFLPLILALAFGIAGACQG